MSQGHDSEQDVVKNEDHLLLAAYRDASTDFPSPEVDDALRAAARRAAGARPRSPGRFRFGSWNTPLAAAATVVLSATVVFMTLRDHGTDELAAPPASGQAPAVRLHAEKEAVAPIQMPAVPGQGPSALSRVPESPAEVSAPLDQRTASATPSAPSESIVPGVVPAAPASPAVPDASVPRVPSDGGMPGGSVDVTTSGHARDSATRDLPHDTAVLTEPATVDASESLHPLALPSPGVPAQQAGDSRALPAAGARAAPRSTAQLPPSGLGEVRQAKPESKGRAPQSRARLSSPPSAEEAPTPSVRPGPLLDADSRRGEEDAAIDSQPADLARKQSAPDAVATDGRAQDNAAPLSPVPDGVSSGAQSPPPAERVERIRGLLRAGKRADALTALTELRRAYPDYSLPADLAELAKSLPVTSR